MIVGWGRSMSKTSSAIIGIVGLAFGAVGVAGYNAKDFFIEKYFPHMASATVEDIGELKITVDEVTIKVEEAAAANKSAAEEIVETNTKQLESLEQTVSAMQALVDDYNKSLEDRNEQKSPTQRAEFEYAARTILQSNRDDTEKARKALLSQETAVAAASLVEVAVQQEENSQVSNLVAAETWRQAAALLYTIDPAKSADAYKKAAELTNFSPQYNDLALLAMERERRRRASEDAPGARLVEAKYEGPIKTFSEPFVFGGVEATPQKCTAQEANLACEIALSLDSQQRLEIENVKLVDDWGRQFLASTVSISGGRSVNDENLRVELAPGQHTLVIQFERIPGGSSYGLEIRLNDQDRFRWRSIPTNELSTDLRDSWGGPLGIASFVPINQEKALSPYGIKLLGCERLGRRLACMGEFGYEGPEHKVQFRDLRLVDSQGRLYRAYYTRLGKGSSSGEDVDVYHKTGISSFEVYFWATPIDEELSLTGSVNKQSFQFNPFRTDQNDSEAQTRLNYFWETPPRVGMGGELRLGDFKFLPLECSRKEYTAKCDIEFVYVGENRKLTIRNTNLVDHENNYYPAHRIELGERSTNSDDFDIYTGAGRYKLTAHFDSIPSSRLYELEMRVDNFIDVVITDLPLPNSEGSLGLPTDIEYLPINAVSNFDNLEIATDGCTKRTSGIVCYGLISYSGPELKHQFRDTLLTLEDGTKLPASSIRVGSSTASSNSVDAYFQTGAYPFRVHFENVTSSEGAKFSMNLRSNGEIEWALPN